jgi:outer membrane lipoprotein-sorting protein
VLAAVTTPATAQTAGEIIDRYIDAIGGRQALAKIETMKYDRTVLNTENEATSQQSRKTIYRKRPYFFRTEDAQTVRIFVSDGTDGWSGTRAASSDSIAWRQVSARSSTTTGRVTEPSTPGERNATASAWTS